MELKLSQHVTLKWEAVKDGSIPMSIMLVNSLTNRSVELLAKDVAFVVAGLAEEKVDERRKWSEAENV